MRAALAGLVLLSGCAQPAAAWREQVIAIPMRDAAGQATALHTRICRPAGDAPASVVVINHGSPPVAADRARTRPLSCDAEAARWFLARGFVVVAPVRRGFGDSPGPFAEGAGPGCTADGYQRGGLEAARDIDAAVAYATALPYARPDRAVVVGQSAGGWGTLAYASQAHPQVAALVSMAGGRGGWVDNQPNRNCRPDQLAEAAGRYGRSARLPMLWVYAANDSYFSPAIAEDLRARFTAAGGRATLLQPGPFGTDGHRLFLGNGGSAIWGPMMARYLAERGYSLPP